MGFIPIGANRSAEAEGYVRAVTGVGHAVPLAPSVRSLGQELLTHSHFTSLQVSESLGFAFVDLGASSDARILSLDYWWTSEHRVKAAPSARYSLSWVFGVGYRVGVSYAAKGFSGSVSLSMLAAEAQMNARSVSVQVRRSGLPEGPEVPTELATATELDVDKYSQLVAWQKEVVSYVKAEESRAALQPTLIGLNLVSHDDLLISTSKSLAFAMWRIYKGSSLNRALELREESTELAEGEISSDVVQTVYATLLREPEYLLGRGSRDRAPSADQRREAEVWLFKYKNV